MALVGWLHAALLRLVIWLVRQVGKSLWFTVGAVLALLGEEIRRYLGLALWGVVIWLAGKATMSYAPEAAKLPLVLTILALVVIWGLAVLRSARFTMHNNLRRVRERKFFRELKGEVGQLGGRLDNFREGLGRRARGTPAEGIWKSNREDRARERAEAQEAADRATAERAEAERQARAEVRAKAARDRELERMGAEHDPFAKQGS